MLLGWSSVDPQMAQYNFTGDSATIFEKRYIEDIQTGIVASDQGNITEGCFLQNGTFELSRVNSSWAVGSTIRSFDYPISPNAGKLDSLFVICERRSDTDQKMPVIILRMPS